MPLSRDPIADRVSTTTGSGEPRVIAGTGAAGPAGLVATVAVDEASFEPLLEH
jgi:hypothetical protein